MKSSVSLSRVSLLASCPKILFCVMLGLSLSFSGVALAQAGMGKKEKSSMKSKSKKKNPSYVSVDLGGLLGFDSTKEKQETTASANIVANTNDTGSTTEEKDKEDYPHAFNLGLAYNHGFKGFTLSAGGEFLVYSKHVVAKDGDKYQDVMPSAFGFKAGGKANVYKGLTAGLNGYFNALVKMWGDKTYSGMHAGAELVVAYEVYKNVSLKLGGGWNFWQSEVKADDKKENHVDVWVPKFFVSGGVHLSVYQL